MKLLNLFIAILILSATTQQVFALEVSVDLRASTRSLYYAICDKGDEDCPKAILWYSTSVATSPHIMLGWFTIAATGYLTHKLTFAEKELVQMAKEDAVMHMMADQKMPLNAGLSDAINTIRKLEVTKDFSEEEILVMIATFDPEVLNDTM